MVSFYLKKLMITATKPAIPPIVKIIPMRDNKPVVSELLALKNNTPAIIRIKQPF